MRWNKAVPTRLLLLALLLPPLLPAPAAAQASIQIQLGVPMPPAPTLVVIQPGIQVVAGYPEEVFHQGGYYWLRRDGGWYRSSHAGSGYQVIQASHVPPGLAKLPPGHYRNYEKGKNHQKKDKHEDKHGQEH